MHTNDIKVSTVTQSTMVAVYKVEVTHASAVPGDNESAEQQAVESGSPSEKLGSQGYADW